LTIGATAQQQHERISMDANWRFHLGDAADPARDFNYGLTALYSKSGKADSTAISPAFSDTGWRNLNLPHDWAVELPFVNSPSFDVMSHGYKPVGRAYPATSIGWYRKPFVIQPADSGKRFRITFDGVFRDSKVWINGFYLGTHASGYTGSSYDITDYLRYGRDNILVVRVDATQYEGWFYEGAGIYRHVWLDSYAPLHIAENGIFAHSRIEGKQAFINVETDLLNEGEDQQIARVTATLLDRDGRVLSTITGNPIQSAPG
jgi:beta-galactosidase